MTNPAHQNAAPGPGGVATLAAVPSAKAASTEARRLAGVAWQQRRQAARTAQGQPS